MAKVIVKSSDGRLEIGVKEANGNIDLGTLVITGLQGMPGIASFDWRGSSSVKESNRKPYFRRRVLQASKEDYTIQGEISFEEVQRMVELLIPEKEGE